MASSQSVWGIEIGQTALKALRCNLDGGDVVATAFDYIEYPKILSQPEAVPEELIADALAQLLERNESALSEKVCISVPGQSGLAKFLKPPPVEVKKIADIVRYEARQQIPFDLADVVWDFHIASMRSASWWKSGGRRTGARWSWRPRSTSGGWRTSATRTCRRSFVPTVWSA